MTRRQYVSKRVWDQVEDDDGRFMEAINGFDLRSGAIVKGITRGGRHYIARDQWLVIHPTGGVMHFINETAARGTFNWISQPASPEDVKWRI